MLIRVLLLLLTGFACKSVFAGQVQYILSMDTSLEVLNLSVCFKNVRSKHLESNVRNGRKFIRIHPRFGHWDNNKIRIKKLDKSGCLPYRVDLLAFQKQNKRSTQRWSKISKDIFLLPTSLWLWLPTHYNDDTEFALWLKKPTNINVSLPWAPSTENGRIYPFKPEYFLTKSVFGRFQQNKFKKGSILFDISFTNKVDDVKRKQLVHWIENAVAAVSTVHGKFPTNYVQVLLTPISQGSEAAPYAHVLRGGGISIQFFIMPEHPIKNFIEDWTAYHEFSHLLLPFIDLKDAWVSEGIASYYQYLVMARHGVVSEEQAFRRFWGGIKRGFDNYHRTSGRPLSEVSKNVRRYGAHRRVYWTGALLWFQADLILRKSGNSLDKVLAEFARKHHPEDDTMSARELSKVLDDIVGYPLFVPLFSQAQDLTAYPDYRELFNRIGIQIKGNELSFAPSKLRKALVTPVLESPLQMGNTERPSIQP